MAITNKEILEEIEKLKRKIPTANGEFILMKKSVEDLTTGQSALKSIIHDLKERLLNPDDGVVARVNRNSEFRKIANKGDHFVNKVLKIWKIVLIQF